MWDGSFPIFIPLSPYTPPWVVHLTFVSISILDPVAYNPKLQHPPPFAFPTKAQINGRAHFEHEVQSRSGKLNKRGAKESSDRLYKTITFSCTRASAVDKKHLKAFLSGSRRAASPLSLSLCIQTAALCIWPRPVDGGRGHLKLPKSTFFDARKYLFVPSVVRISRIECGSVAESDNI